LIGLQELLYLILAQFGTVLACVATGELLGIRPENSVLFYLQAFMIKWSNFISTIFQY
jgi:hypothetical protein